MTHISKVLAVLSIILLCLLPPVSSEQQKRDEGRVERHNTLTDVIHWAQVLSSLVETFFEGGDLQGWIEKLRGPAYLKMLKTDGGEKVVSKLALHRSGKDKDVSKVSHIKSVNSLDGSREKSTSFVNNDANAEGNCSHGVLGVPISSIFFCNGRNVTGAAYALLTPSRQSLCSFLAGTGTVCICPLGTTWVLEGVNQKWACSPRFLIASPRLSDEFICRNEIQHSPLGFERRSESDFCLRVHRRTTLNVPVNISYRWAENNEIENLRAVTGGVIVFGKVVEEEEYVALGKGIVGKYEELQRSSVLFKFSVKPNSSQPYPFGMHSRHALQKDGYFERIMYPFAHPELMEGERRLENLSSRSAVNRFFGGTGNFTVHDIKLDFGSVGNEFLTGNTLYMEIGFAGGGFLFGNCHARMWITFEDFPTPPEQYEYKQSVNPLIIAGIVIAAALFLGIMVALLKRCCCQERFMEDSLVTGALRERENKKRR